jgi:hypothetical protein
VTDQYKEPCHVTSLSTGRATEVHISLWPDVDSTVTQHWQHLAGDESATSQPEQHHHQ